MTTQPNAIPLAKMTDVNACGPVELRARGNDSAGNTLWDAYDTLIKDWVAVMPAFPTANKARVVTCVSHMNRGYAERAKVTTPAEAI